MFTKIVLRLIAFCNFAVVLSGCSLPQQWSALTKGGSADQSAPAITVVAPSGLTYSATSITVYQNQALTPVAATVTSGTVDTYSISPGLPAGMTLNTTTGAIAGTPTAFAGTGTYTITATNAAGSTQTTVTLTVWPNFIVNSTADAADSNLADSTCDNGSGACTLRAAIQQANSLALPTVVTVPAGTITLSLGEILVTTKIQIVGDTMATSIVSANNASRVFNITSQTATLKNITLQNGLSAAAAGGAVYYYNVAVGSTLTIDQVTVKNSVTNSTMDGGGGLYFFGQLLNITGSVFKSNSESVGAGGNLGGGGLFIATGKATISTTLFQSNSAISGGGVRIQGGMGHVFTDCTFLSNAATGAGGGAIYDVTFSSNKISRSLFESNTSAYNGGGAVYYQQGSSQIIENSTFYGNTVTGAFNNYGGAVYYDSSSSMFFFPKIQFSTFVGNSATTGGGIYSYAAGGGITQVGNSIFSGNAGGNCGAMFGISAFQSLGYNIDSAATCSFAATGDVASTNPLVVAGAPVDNGGPTHTIALQSSSPARAAGNSAVCPSVDQRSVARPVGTACAIGAYEY